MTLTEITEKTKNMLGENYREGTVSLEDICTMVIQETAQWTNRYTDVNATTDHLLSLMEDCWPIIIRCSCVAYLNRGAEGLNSQSELGQQNVYTNWVDLLHKQATNRRYIV